MGRESLYVYIVDVQIANLINHHTVSIDFVTPIRHVRELACSKGRWGVLGLFEAIKGVILRYMAREPSLLHLNLLGHLEPKLGGPGLPVHSAPRPGF